MEDRKNARVADDLPVIPDPVLIHVMSYMDDPKDKDAISLVCRQWYEIDALMRKHVTIALCYATSPYRLQRRFKQLESLKLKGKPRASMFNLIPENWGGYVGPWVREIAPRFDCLKALHFRRMIVTDADLQMLATFMGRVLQVLKLDKCSGFSSNGLIYVSRLCKSLRTLFLEESTIDDEDGAWLHELALNNTVLETLNFYMTDLQNVCVKDLVLIAKNCPKLVSVKVSDCEMMELVDFFRAATALEEFGGGSFNNQPEIYSAISFSPKLCRIGLSFIGKNEIYILFPLAAGLKKLDLLYALLDTDDHCLLIQKCHNLEVLETRNVIGDRGLDVLAQSCKRLKRLRIERGADELDMEDEGGLVTQRGLIALAQGCLELEYLAIYVSDITNAALESVGSHLKNLYDFRLVLLDREEVITDLPLDIGVRCLLRGCEKLIRFALYLRPGGLTDVGLGYIGKYSPHVRWVLLGYVGETDAGLQAFSRGCPSLQKLEIRGCCFSMLALADAVMHLTSLRYLWVQGYRGSKSSRDILAMHRPFWNIELIQAKKVVVHNEVGGSTIRDDPGHILAYYSLVGPRTDSPEAVIPLQPPRLLYILCHSHVPLLSFCTQEFLFFFLLALHSFLW